MPMPGLSLSPGHFKVPAFPVLMGSPGTFAQGTTSAVIPLPGGIVVGELLIIALAVGADTNRTVTPPSGWDTLRNVAGTSVRRWVVLSRIADGSEGASVTVGLSGSGSPGVVAISLRIRGWTGISMPASAAQSTSASADPPALSPEFGQGPYLWIALAAYRNAAEPSAFPANYEAEVHSGWGSDDNISVALAHRLLASDSDDPGAFTVPSSYWFADTIAIKGEQ